MSPFKVGDIVEETGRPYRKNGRLYIVTHVYPGVKCVDVSIHASKDILDIGTKLTAVRERSLSLYNKRTLPVERRTNIRR